MGEDDRKIHLEKLIFGLEDIDNGPEHLLRLSYKNLPIYSDIEEA